MERQETMKELGGFLSDDEKTVKVLSILKARGFRAELKNRENHHVQAWSRHGKVYNYYPTTGTIMAEPECEGLDDLLRLLDEY